MLWNCSRNFWLEISFERYFNIFFACLIFKNSFSFLLRSSKTTRNFHSKCKLLVTSEKQSKKKKIEEGHLCQRQNDKSTKMPFYFLFAKYFLVVCLYVFISHLKINEILKFLGFCIPEIREMRTDHKRVKKINVE